MGLRRRTVLILACATLLVALTGCSSPGEAPSEGAADEASTQGAATEAPTQELTSDDLADWGMPVAEKQNSFPPGFPWQAPVIDGEIVAAQVDAAGTHTYRIEVARPAEQVAEWYRRSYPNANWVLHDERTSVAGTTTTTVLEVTKGQGAWSRVLIEGDESAAVVEASVGIGSPPAGVF
jgi:hypothetical protein